MLATLILTAVAVSFTSAWGLFTPDTKPELYLAPGRFFSTTLSAWVPGQGQAGTPNFNTGVAPLAALIWALRSLGLPAWVAVRVWRVALYVVAGWGARRYFHALNGRSTPASRVAAASVFVANAYVVTQGATTPILLPYAFLPWLLLAHLRSLSEPKSWRYASWFALAFFAMGGLNAGVIPFFFLFALVGQVAAVRMADRVPWRAVGSSIARCAPLAFGVSLYWLLPALLATRTGAAVLAATEDPRNVALTTSYAENSRLLGNWPIYGRTGDRLFLPGYSSYLTNPFVVAASFLVPVAAALGATLARSRVRAMALVTLAVALPVMVGTFPPESPPAWGRLIGSAFDAVPATAAFRTTAKIGGLVALAIALLFAAGAQRLLPTAGRAWRASDRGIVAVAALVLVTATWPAWSGKLYTSAWNVPGYWRQAAADLNNDAAHERVLAVPGGAGGNYRWGMRSPDDLLPSLLDVDHVSRSVVSPAGDPAANFMAGWETAMLDGDLDEGALRATARYLGARQVLVRNDTLVEDVRGPAPSVVAGRIAREPGLRRVAVYGRRGQNTQAPDSSPPSADADAALHPLERYRTDAAKAVRTEPARGALIVDGDGFALPQLVGVGLLDGRRPWRLAGDLTAAELSESIRNGDGIALTDTNRRRAWNANRVGDAYSPTLSVEDSESDGQGPSLTLWPDRPATQTVTRIRGGRRIEASTPNFGLHPDGRPEYAFDGNSSTRWMTGTLGTGLDSHVSLELGRTVRVTSIQVTPAATAPARPTQARITIGDRVVTVAFPDARPVTVRFAPTRIDRVTLEITGVSDGFNEIGISDVTIPGVNVTVGEVMPSTVAGLLDRLPAEVRRAAGQLPFDVLLVRQAGKPNDEADDEERALDREFRMPFARTLDMTIELHRVTDQAVLIRSQLEGGECVAVATIDGRAVRARLRPGTTVGARISLEPCGPALRLTRGVHRFRAAPFVLIDRVRFSASARRPSFTQSPQVRTVASTNSSVTVEVPGSSTGPYYFLTGQAFDPRWGATMDGHDLGPPIIVDGYSVGWLVDEPGPHRISVRFGPQTVVKGSFAVSGLFLIGIAVLAVDPAVRRRYLRRRPPRPANLGPAGG